MEAEIIAIQKSESQDIVREATYLDIREVPNDELSEETLRTCQKADNEEFSDNSALSFDEVYKKCIKWFRQVEVIPV